MTNMHLVTLIWKADRLMLEILCSNDPVLLSWVVTYLGDSGINAVVFDRNVSILEGSVGAIPRRVMVPEEDLATARALLREADIDYVE